MLLRFEKVGFWRSWGNLRRGPWGTGEVENAKLFYKIEGLDETIP